MVPACLVIGSIQIPNAPSITWQINIWIPPSTNSHRLPTRSTITIDTIFASTLIDPVMMAVNNDVFPAKPRISKNGAM